MSKQDEIDAIDQQLGALSREKDSLRDKVKALVAKRREITDAVELEDLQSKFPQFDIKAR